MLSGWCALLVAGVHALYPPRMFWSDATFLERNCRKGKRVNCFVSWFTEQTVAMTPEISHLAAPFSLVLTRLYLTWTCKSYEENSHTKKVLWRKAATGYTLFPTNNFQLIYFVFQKFAANLIPVSETKVGILTCRCRVLELKAHWGPRGQRHWQAVRETNSRGPECVLTFAKRTNRVSIWLGFIRWGAVPKNFGQNFLSPL